MADDCAEDDLEMGAAEIAALACAAALPPDDPLEAALRRGLRCALLAAGAASSEVEIAAFTALPTVLGAASSSRGAGATVAGRRTTPRSDCDERMGATETSTVDGGLATTAPASNTAS